MNIQQKTNIFSAKENFAHLTSAIKVFFPIATWRPAGLSARIRVGSGEVLRRMCCLRGKTGEDSALLWPGILRKTANYF